VAAHSMRCERPFGLPLGSKLVRLWCETCGWPGAGGVFKTESEAHAFFETHLNNPGEAPIDWMRLDAQTVLDVINTGDWLVSKWPHEIEAQEKLIGILETLARSGRR